MVQSLRTILQNNFDLQELDIKASDDFFAQSSELKFKLRKLWIKSESPGDTNYLRPFLETQAQTLESLEMYVLHTRACLDLILGGMPRLTSFVAEYFDIAGTHSNWYQQLPVNTTITSLEVIGRLDKVMPIPYQTLIRAMSGLKNFKSDKIDDEMLLALAQICIDLESIETEWFKFSRLPEGDIFRKIKKFKAGYIMQGLQEPIGENNFAKLIKERLKKHFWNIWLYTVDSNS